ncbi:hypothetical protein [Streptomyces sp. NPDC093109]|uniref:hypothetical protein n=1 Tax=Streptomyces sp. NPDC093109 TaxID=3154977 RepID=UPI00345062C0
MADSDRTGGEPVTMHAVEIPLDVKRACGARFIPSASCAFEDSVRVYRPSPNGDEKLHCTEADLARWAAAERAYLDTLSRALEEFYRAHGGWNARVDLLRGIANWTPLPPFLRLPGRRKRARIRSHNAQRAFLAAIEPATKTYESVRDEITQRIKSRHRTAKEIADQRVWNYITESTDMHSGTVFLVYRCDLSPIPTSPPKSPRPLNAHQLDAQLSRLGGLLGLQRIRWEPRARARVAQECRELGLPITFTEWWHIVTDELWEPAAEQSPKSQSVSGSSSGNPSSSSASHSTPQSDTPSPSSEYGHGSGRGGNGDYINITTEYLYDQVANGGTVRSTSNDDDSNTGSGDDW